MSLICWLIIRSKGALERAVKSVERAISKEKERADKQLFHLQAQRFDSEAEAMTALQELSDKWKYHDGNDLIIAGLLHCPASHAE